MTACLLLLGLGGCGGPIHGKDELEAQRAEIIATAASDLTALAAALDAEVESTWGEWSAGGAKNNFQLSYSVTVDLEDVAATDDAMVAAMEDLGYDVVRADQSRWGERDNMTLRVGSHPALGLRAQLSGPYLRTETGLVNFGREDIDLGQTSS